MANEGYHEPIDLLPPDVMDRHRAIVSIMEELEAVDWYDQRVAATDNSELADILAHNRDEEKEHAAMAIEWLRRNDPTFDRELRTYLFTESPVAHTEEIAMAGGSGESVEMRREEATSAGSEAATSSNSSLGIGSLKINVEESGS